MIKNAKEFINLEEARSFSESTLRMNIGERTKYLYEELGMEKQDAQNFVSSLLNLGASMQELFDRKKTSK